MEGQLALAAMAASTLIVAGLADAAEPPAASGAGVEAKPRATLTVRTSRYGRILFDGGGRVLYGFTRDRRGGASRCYGACARAWPVYFSPRTALRAGFEVKKSLIGTTRRRAGHRQLTYNGWPLYCYAHEGPGEVRCQNVDQFGGLWLVVRPNGKLVH